MNNLWTADELVSATGGRPFGIMPGGVGGISIDTRSLAPGDAFFAIAGEKHDGHDFATAAIAAGASVLVVNEARLPGLGRLNKPMIVVPDVLAALVSTGIAARARTRARVIAVTGSAGKTTTKEMLRHVLGASGTVHASDKSYNNHWGVPLTLARLPEECDYAVLEIGMNHPGEIRPLTGMVRPHIAIVTLIAAAHLGHFSGLEEIAAAKAEIFEGVEPGGAALINRDDAHWKFLETAARAAGVAHVYGFGENARATFQMLKAKLAGDHSLLTAEIAGNEVVARIGVPGRHIVQNALAVLGAAHLAGADPTRSAATLATLEAERGRGRRYLLFLPGGTATLIDESYNANPASMRAALGLLDATSPAEGGRRIAVLGDMLELGAFSRDMHADLAQAVLDARADVVFLGGKEMVALAGALPDTLAIEHRASAEELKALVVEAIAPGDVVVVKSSNGIGFSKLVDALVAAYPPASAADAAN